MIRMSGGEAVTAGAVAQQPGELGDLRVLTGVTSGVERGGPGGGGQRAEHGADPVVEVEPDRVAHLVTGSIVEFADVADRGVGGPGPVTGD
ncbi:MAG: hypothetical protein ACRDSM_23900 [Pseudonocardiaceae bacterium]